MPNPPPELLNYVVNAYNAKDGDFLSRPVFKVSYNKGQTIQWHGAPADIPDQVSASAGTRSITSNTALLMETKADYDRTFSASVDAAYSGITYSGSVQSSLLYHGNLFSSTSAYYALNFMQQVILTFQRVGPLPADLDPDFAASLRALPQQISSAEQINAYYAFFNAYGTHYATLGALGGTIVMESEISDSVFESTNQLDVSVGITAGFEAVIGSGSLNVSTAYSESDFLSTHRNQIALTINALGGLYTQDATISSWQTSLYSAPVLVFNVPTRPSPPLSALQCISALVALADASPVIASNIDTLIQGYVNNDLSEDGLLSTPTPSPLSVVDTAGQADGFLLATIEATTDGPRGYVQCFDDPSEDPTTVRGCAGQHWFTVRDHWIPVTSAMIPTPHGTSFTTVFTPTAAEPRCTALHCGLGNIGDASLGAWQAITVNKAINAPSDGFVVAFIDCNDVDGARGYIQCAIKGANGIQTIAGASQHYFLKSDIQVRCNSFCVPMRSGVTYDVAFLATALTPTAQAYFVPLGASYALLEPQSRRPDITYQAQTDGFLLVYLYAQHDGDRGRIDLYTHRDPGELMKLGRLSATSVHYFTGSDTFVPHNTATIPVTRKNFYRVGFTPTSGQPAVSALWIPLGAALT